MGNNTMKLKDETYNANSSKVSTGDLEVEEGPCYALTFTLDDKVLITSHNNSIKFWDHKLKKCICTFEHAHTHSIYSMAISSEGKYLITGSKGHTIKMWNINKKHLSHTFTKVHEDGTLEMVPSNSNNLLLTRCGYQENAEVKLWHVKNKDHLHTFKVPNCLAIALAPNCLFFATSSWTDIKIWNIQTEKITRQIEMTDKSIIIRSLVITKSGKEVIAASNSWIKIWDIDSGSLVETIDYESKLPITTMKIVGDDETLLTASDDGIITIFDLQKRSIVDFLEHYEKFSIRSKFQDPKPRITIAVTKDGSTLVSSSNEGLIKVWNLPARKLDYILVKPKINSD